MTRASVQARRLTIVMPRQIEADRLRAAAADRGLSVNRLIVEALGEVGLIDPAPQPARKFARVPVEELDQLRAIAARHEALA